MPDDLFISDAHPGDDTFREAVALLVAGAACRTGSRFSPPVQPRLGDVLRQRRHQGLRPLAGVLSSGVARFSLQHLTERLAPLLRLLP